MISLRWSRRWKKLNENPQITQITQIKIKDHQIAWLRSCRFVYFVDRFLSWN